MESLPDSETQPTDRLGDLYARHVPATIGFAYLLTGTRVDAEDLVHEAFVRVVGRLRHLRTPDAFDPICSGRWSTSTRRGCAASGSNAATWRARAADRPMP